MTAEPIPGLDVTVERDVPLSLPDGVVLYADVYRPTPRQRCPVLLISHPYDKAVAESNVGYSHPAWFAQHGYVVVTQDCRGRYRSEGVFTPFVHEADDLAATIAWASALPGSDGRVATYGFSYAGLNQLLAAGRAPDGLSAIAPAFTGASPYREWFWRQGAFSLAFAATWANFLAVDVAARRGDDARLSALGAALAAAPGLLWTLPLDAYPPLAGDEAPFFHDWLSHPTYDDYWRALDADLDSIAVPALHVGGWYDVFARGTVRAYRELARRGRAPQKLVLGPWHHMPWRPVGAATPDAGSVVVDDWHLRFWSQVLAGEETGVFDAPVTVYVLGAGWRDLDGWPPSAAVEEDWYLHSDGRALSVHGTGTLTTEAPGPEPPDVFVYEPDLPAPTAGGHSCCVEALVPMGPADQRAAEGTKQILVYTSPPLERPLEVVGDVRVTLYAATTAPDTDFTARLCAVDETGRSTNLLEGIVRARFRGSVESPTPIRPGEVYEYVIELGPVGVHLPAGHRLRLHVSSSDFPQWDRNLNTGGEIGFEGPSAIRAATQTVLHSERYASRVTLPVVRSG